MIPNFFSGSSVDIIVDADNVVQRIVSGKCAVSRIGKEWKFWKDCGQDRLGRPRYRNVQMGSLSDALDEMAHSGGGNKQFVMDGIKEMGYTV
jgi:hypothetical protein